MYVKEILERNAEGMSPRVHYWTSCMGVVYERALKRNTAKHAGGARGNYCVRRRPCMRGKGKHKNRAGKICAQHNRNSEQIVQIQ